MINVFLVVHKDYMNQIKNAYYVIQVVYLVNIMPINVHHALHQNTYLKLNATIHVLLEHLYNPQINVKNVTKTVYNAKVISHLVLAVIQEIIYLIKHV